MTGRISIDCQPLTVTNVRLPKIEELNENEDVVWWIEGHACSCFVETSQEEMEEGVDPTWGPPPWLTNMVFIVPVVEVKEDLEPEKYYMLKDVPFRANGEHELLCAFFIDCKADYHGISDLAELEELCENAFDSFKTTED